MWTVASDSECAHQIYGKRFHFTYAVESDRDGKACLRNVCGSHGGQNVRHADPLIEGLQLTLDNFVLIKKSRQ